MNRNLLSLLLVCSSQFVSAQTDIRGIVNDYTAASATTCSNSILVDDAAAFSTGDLVLIIQMKGASIDLSNTASFGNISDYGSTGKYEVNEVSAIGIGELFLTYTISNTYDFSGAVLVVRVASYGDVLVDSTLTCAPWNGTTGGILAIYISGDLTLAADVDVSGKGFAGGEFANYPDSCPFGLSWNGYKTSITSGNGAPKGEGFTTVGDADRGGRGKLANGGGGGNDHNAGGGGGSSGASGGQGGERDVSLFSCPGPGVGLPGVVPDHSNIENRIYLGGGGGAGHGNNGNATAGGNGGGIALIMAHNIDGNGHTIRANGNSLPLVNADGGGGGGAGGSLLLDMGAISSDFLTELKGGDGSDISGYACTGPGGGGSGGIIRHTGPGLPAGIFNDLAGGTAGVTVTVGSDCYNSSNGAADGEIGSIVADWPLLYSEELYISDFAQVNADTSICAGNSIELLAEGGDSYSWSPPDGLSDPDIANPICTPEETTTYTVTVTNAIGCTDTASFTVEVVPGVEAIAGPDTTLCGPNQVFFFASGGDTYFWTPSTGVSNVNIANPIVFVTETTDYIVTVSNGTCSATDTVSVEIIPLPALVTNPDTTICQGVAMTLYASGADTYLWSPAASVPCTDCSSMEVSPMTTTSYTVTGYSADGCSATITFQVTVEICNGVDEVYNLIAAMYPNPASTELSIRLAHNIQAEALFQLFDVQGKLIQEWTLLPGLTTYSFDISQLPGGQYLFVLLLEDGKQTGRIVVE
jgi:hypothetical protein